MFYVSSFVLGKHLFYHMTVWPYDGFTIWRFDHMTVWTYDGGSMFTNDLHISKIREQWNYSISNIQNMEHLTYGMNIQLFERPSNELMQYTSVCRQYQCMQAAIWMKYGWNMDDINITFIAINITFILKHDRQMALEYSHFD